MHIDGLVQERHNSSALTPWYLIMSELASRYMTITFSFITFYWCHEIQQTQHLSICQSITVNASYLHQSLLNISSSDLSRPQRTTSRGPFNKKKFFYYIYNRIWWLCLIPTSTTRLALGYRMAKNLIGLYKEILFMNNDIRFLNIEWRTRYSPTKFDDHFGLRASVIFRP